MNENNLFDVTNERRENLLTVKIGSTLNLGIVVGTDLIDMPNIRYTVDGNKRSISPKQFLEFAEENDLIYNKSTLHYVMSEYLRTETAFASALTKINRNGDIYLISVELTGKKLILEDALLGEESREMFDNPLELNERLKELCLSPVPVFQTRKGLKINLNQWVRLYSHSEPSHWDKIPTERVSFARFTDKSVIEVVLIDILSGNDIFVQRHTIDLMDDYQLELLNIFNYEVDLSEVLHVGNNPLLVAYAEVSESSIWECDELIIFSADKSISKGDNTYHSIYDFAKAMKEELDLDIFSILELSMIIGSKDDNETN